MTPSSFFHFNATSFLLAAGYLGLFVGVFAETGFLIGIVLPGGETLVFAAGILAALGYFNIGIVIAIVFVAAVAADSLEYAFGKKYGPKVFTKEGSRFFDKTLIEKSRAFYGRHGAKTVLLARFLPFIRTLAPAFAGVGNMRYRTFVAYNVAGAAIWAAGVGLIGYYLGRAFPSANNYLVAIVIAIAILSALASWVAVRKKIH